MERFNDTIRALAQAFSRLDGCSAMAVSGSRTSQINDQASDWDIYVYRKERILPEVRAAIIGPLCDSMSIDASFFEEGDEFSKDGVYYDVMYRDEAFIQDQIERVWVRHQPSLGYSTCFLHNLRTSRFIFDKAALAARISTLDGPYPEALAKAIIDYNRRMTSGDGEATWVRQLDLAVKRGDYVSRNHRLAALMASYFDMLFAYNRVLHPGEKKIMGYCHLLCSRLPEDFDQDIEAIYSTAYDGPVVENVERALAHLYALIDD